MGEDVPAGQGRRWSETAGEAAVRDVPRAAPDAKAGEVRVALAGHEFDSATDIAVLEGEHLVGVVPIERLFASTDDRPLRELVVDVVSVPPERDLEAATRATAQRGRRTMAVIDAEGRFHGLVPPEGLLHILELEHEEDLARLGGILTSTSVARRASEEAVPRRLWHRLPWLGLGLLGAMAAAVIVGAFEDELRKEILLALFVPAVVYMADAVATQTETVVIRGMSLGVPVRAIVTRELTTGIAIGALVGSLFFPFALAVWGNARVAATVGPWR